MTIHHPETPDDALAELAAGNARFVEHGARHACQVRPGEQLASGQTPCAAVLRCADSRVAPELWFDQPLGRLFVCGVAGNLPTTEVIASLEYAVAVLGVKTIVVAGHSNCGAVAAALEHWTDSSALPGLLPGLVDQVIAACAQGVDASHADAHAQAIEINARAGAAALTVRSSIIGDAVSSGALKVVSGVQNLETGRFETSD